MSETQTAKPDTGIVSGIHTDALIEADPPSFWVNWIDWDSDFRRELRVDDHIVAINGQSLSHILQPQKIHKGIGQHGEVQYWQEIGAVAGNEIELSLLRNDEPATARGRLGSGMFYYDREGKPALAPGGPARMARDSFNSTWASWYEDIQRSLSIVFTRVWRDKIATRPELERMLAHQPRIEYLLANYPGLFAQTMHDDWARAVEVLRGRKADPPVNLDYRQIGQQRVAVAKAAAARAWKALLDETAGDRIPAAPAVSPLERDGAVGKIVELPAITNDNVRNSLDKTFAFAGSNSDGYWFLLLDRPEFHEFYRTFYRFQGSVNPQLKERYRYLGRVLEDPWMLPVDGRPVMGLTIQPIAALAGEDELFVDLRQSPAQFAGEAELSVFAAVPRDDNSPASVMEAMIHAVKTGDEVGWRSLFAPWRVLAGPSGRSIIDMTYAASPSMYASAWDHSRRNIVGEVLDVRISRVDKVRSILSRAENDSLPDVDQVVVWVDHYGLFDGEERAFQNVNVNRRWPLQRIDGGPWRIGTIQTL